MKSASGPRKTALNESQAYSQIEDSKQEPTKTRVTEVRKSVVASGLGQQKASSIRKSIARASVSFSLADGTEAGDVLIENDRLKTSVAILSGKLKSAEDSQAIIDSLRTQNRELDSENQQLKSTIASLETNVETQSVKIDDLHKQLAESEDARRQLKVELGGLSEKMIVLEEELYESKTVQLELLDTIKYLEG